MRKNEEKANERKMNWIADSDYFLFQNEERRRKANREDDEDDEAGAQEGHPRDAQDFHTLGKNKKLVEIWGEGAGELKWILKL